MTRFKLLRIIAAVGMLAISAPAFAQFPATATGAAGAPGNMPPPKEDVGGGATSQNAGGPVAMGQVSAQIDPQGRVTILQAPPIAPPPANTNGGIINLSAFGWLQPYVDTLVQSLIVVGFGWFAKSKYGQMMDQSSRDALMTFAKNRASALIADGAVRMRGKTIDIHSAALATAANESKDAIPDAMKRFGLTPEAVAAKIVAAIPQTSAGAQIIANAHAVDPDPPAAVTSVSASKPDPFIPPAPPSAA